MSAAIEFREVCFSTAQGRLLLDHISLELQPATTTVILGRSGSGKTTLLRTINRLVEPTTGEVLVSGHAVRTQNLISLRRNIGYVIQETGLFPHFTVERNVGIVLEAQSQPATERTRRSHELLTLVGLDPAAFATRYPHQLSGGQRQRVGLARALAAGQQTLMMDEPFGALDPLTRAEMQDMLRSILARMSKTVILVTHDLNEALYLAHRIVLMSEGKLISNLAPKDFLASTDPNVQAYISAYYRGEQNAAEGRQP